MADTVIRAENLGKKFVIGHRDTRDTMFREAMMRGARNFWRKGRNLVALPSLVRASAADQTQPSSVPA